MAEFILEGLSQGDVGVSVNKKCEDTELFLKIGFELMCRIPQSYSNISEKSV